MFSDGPPLLPGLSELQQPHLQNGKTAVSRSCCGDEVIQRRQRLFTVWQTHTHALKRWLFSLSFYYLFSCSLCIISNTEGHSKSKDACSDLSLFQRRSPRTLCQNQNSRTSHRLTRALRWGRLPWCGDRTLGVLKTCSKGVCNCFLVKVVDTH